MPCSHARGLVSIPLVIAVLVLVFLMGFSGSFQVSNARTAMERIYARRLMDLVANSAFEETCSRLEGLLPLQRIPPPVKKRELAAEVLGSLALPQSFAPALTRADVADQRVEVGDVSFRSSPWFCEYTPEPGGTVIVQELGIFEFKVRVKASVGSTTMDQVFTARRYVDASPDPGGSLVKIKIQTNNMALRVE